MALEPPVGHMARFLLAGLHRIGLAQSIVRQGQGPVLATGLYQCRPLDYRAPPGAARRLGDVAGRVPLHDQPGATGVEDRGGRGGGETESERHVDYFDGGVHKNSGSGEWDWTPNENPQFMQADYSGKLRDKLAELKIDSEESWPEKVGAGAERLERVWAVKRWYDDDWMKLDNKVRSSVVEGVAVFLSMFDLPDVAKVFCPAPPPKWDPEVDAKRRAAVPDPDDEITSGGDVLATSIKRHLPPLDELIESGKVLALNMPVGTNPALARAIGVMLKNAWLQALLRRPAAMKETPGLYFRPAVFICDEYQSFASVGEDDPSGDEKAFALTRQCRVIPIVATQSISSLRSVLGSSEAWRTLLQTLRTRIFLSLSDDASARIASELCGQVAKIKGSYTLTESAKRAGISPLSGRAGGGAGNIGASKSFQERREAVFHPRDFALLSNCQAICLPYDGAQSLEPRRVYLKPHYLPRDLSYWRQLRDGRI